MKGNIANRHLYTRVRMSQGEEAPYSVSKYELTKNCILVVLNLIKLI